MEKARRIVVIRPGALGDTLLTFPALGWLGRRFPSAHLTLIARSDVLPLARQARLATTTWPYDLPDWAPLFADPLQPLRMIERARETFERADIVIAWLADPEGNVARNLRALGVGLVLVAPGRPSERQPLRHAALQLFDALRPLAAPDTPLPDSIDDLPAYLPVLVPDTDITRSREDARLAQHLPEIVAHCQTPSRLVALHPGSGAAAKRWPPANFAALARLISKVGYQPLLIEGPQDGAVCADVLTQAPETPIVRELALTTLATLLTHCSAYVGNDSGVSHLAGLLGVFSVVIFGPTDPTLWAPVGRMVHVVRAPGGELAQLPMEQVWKTLHRALDHVGS